MPPSLGRVGISDSIPLSDGCSWRAPQHVQPPICRVVGAVARERGSRGGQRRDPGAARQQSRSIGVPSPAHGVGHEARASNAAVDHAMIGGIKRGVHGNTRLPDLGRPARPEGFATRSHGADFAQLVRAGPTGLGLRRLARRSPASDRVSRVARLCPPAPEEESTSWAIHQTLHLFPAKAPVDADLTTIARTSALAAAISPESG